MAIFQNNGVGEGRAVVGEKPALISGIVIPPTLFFFLKIAAAIQGHLWFHINFLNICPIPVKYAIGILIVIVLNL